MTYYPWVLQDGTRSLSVESRTYVIARLCRGLDRGPYLATIWHAGKVVATVRFVCDAEAMSWCEEQESTAWAWAKCDEGKP